MVYVCTRHGRTCGGAPGPLVFRAQRRPGARGETHIFVLKIDVTCGAVSDCRVLGGSDLSPRAHSDKTPSKPRPLPILGLLDPRTATDTGATARSFRVPPWIQAVRKWQRSQCRGLLEQGASAWRRTIIVEVSQFAPPVTGAITAASRTTETSSAAHAARLRRVLAKRHALPTINRRACSARTICHQQAFTGPQHLVGWR